MSTTCLKRTHNTCERHACKLEVRLVLTFQTIEVKQVLVVSLDECRVSLAPALMSSPAASHIVNVVCHYCTRFTLASRGTGCCLQLSNDCLNLVPLPLLTQQQPFMTVKGSCQCMCTPAFAVLHDKPVDHQCRSCISCLMG